MATAVRKFDRATYRFKTRDAAWSFMRACDAGGHFAGYPALRTETVKVALETWMEREAVDALAAAAEGGYEVVEYEFGAVEMPGTGVVEAYANLSEESFS